MKRENVPFSVEMGKYKLIHVVFYRYEIDLNTTVFKTQQNGVYFFLNRIYQIIVLQQND